MPTRGGPIHTRVLMCAIVATFVAVCTAVGQRCVQSVDDDPHPIFGSLFRRVGVEEFVQEFHDATSLTFADVDADGELDILDFVCFRTAFTEGCE